MTRHLELPGFGVGNRRAPARMQAGLATGLVSADRAARDCGAARNESARDGQFAGAPPA